MSVKFVSDAGSGPGAGGQKFVRRLSAVSAVLGALIFLGLLIYFLQFAYRLNVNYFDSYEWLNNAKAIAGADAQYATRRPPVASLVFTPWMLPAGFNPGLRWLELTGPCIESVFIAFFAIFVLVLILRRTVPPQFLRLTLPFILLNRIIMHYTPFPLGDVPGMLFAGLAVYSFLSGGMEHDKKRLFMAGVWAGLSAASKYHNGVLCLALIAAGFARHIPDAPAGGRKKMFFGLCGKYAVFLALVPLAAFFAVNMFAYSGLPDAGFPEKVEILLRAVFRGFRYSSMPGSTDPWNEYLIYMGKVMPVFIRLAMITGMCLAFIRKNHADRLMLSMFFVYFLALSFQFKHKEARYMLPLFIPVYYFAAAGMERIWKYISGPPLGGYLSRAVFSLCVASALVAAFRAAFKEVNLFNEQFFYTPWEKQISAKATETPGKTNTVFWVGNFLPLRPPDYVFHRYEEYYSVFHFAPHVVYFFTGRMPQALPFTWGDFPSSMSPVVRTQPIRDGDSIICVSPWDDRHIFVIKVGLKCLNPGKVPENVLTVYRGPDNDMPAQKVYVRIPPARSKEFFYLVYWLGKVKGLYSGAKGSGRRVFDFEFEKIPVP